MFHSDSKQQFANEIQAKLGLNYLFASFDSHSERAFWLPLGNME
jgi:hypothetical protein